MTLTNNTEAPLWQVGSGRPRPRTAPAKCGLCQDPPASVFGLCLRCLTAAAAEAARLRPRQAPPEDTRRSSPPFAELCRRCGRPGHDADRCDA